MKIREIYNYCKKRIMIYSGKGIFIALTQSKRNRLKKSDILFICHDNHRTTYVNGLRYAPLIDTISDEIYSNFTKITLTGPFSKYHGNTCYGNVVMYNRALLFAYIKRVVFMQSLTIKNVKTDPVVREWFSVLRIIQPKIIIGINPSPELCIAAKSLNIWVADIQHGILAPGNYYDIKKRANINQRGWPNTILCWDQFSKDFVDSNLAPFVQSIVIGHPMIFSNASKKLSYVSNDSVGKINNPISVLVTLTNVSLDPFEDDVYLKEIGFPSTLINFIIKSGSFCIWNIRIHPVLIMKKKDYVFRKLSNIFKDMPNVLWEECNNETIHGALSKCSVHITYNSASAKDAAYIGIHTAVIDTRGEVYTYFEDLIKEGLVTIIDADNHRDLKEWIINNCARISNSNALDSIPMIQGRIRFKSFIDSIELTIKESSKDY